MNATFDTSTVKVATPDGTLYVHIMENFRGTPVHIRAEIGKSGTQIRAWTSAITALINELLNQNVDVTTILIALNSIRTDKVTQNPLGAVRSGPDGIVYALALYLRHKFVADNDIPFLDQSWLKKK